MLDKFIAYTIGTIHIIITLVNLVSVPCLLLYTPFYIWMPIITMLVSPVVGGTYCMFNRMENFYRLKAGLPPIHDRWSSFLDWIGFKI